MGVPNGFEVVTSLTCPPARELCLVALEQQLETRVLVSLFLVALTSLTCPPARELGLVALEQQFETRVLVSLFLVALAPLFGRQLHVDLHAVLDRLGPAAATAAAHAHLSHTTARRGSQVISYRVRNSLPRVSPAK